MNNLRWQMLLGMVLVFLSLFFYFLHFIFFRDPHHIFIFLIGDIAFVFIEVLLVTLIIHQLLTMREKRVRLEKLNTFIGLFFGEVGTKLLAFLSDADPSLETIKKEFIVKDNWSDEEFFLASKRLKSCKYSIEIRQMHLEYLRSFLEKNKEFLVRLLENPALFEHESFTELLRTIFHLTEELTARGDIKDLPDSDYDHLTQDIRRVYVILVHQWLDYMRYLKDNYPYLFSFAMRTNPFDQDASPIVQ